ncbi:MAG TPA: hypothetical protein VF950_12825 [Planctomycetota bacterium]
MKTLAPFLLLLAACRAAPPPGDWASVTVYGDAPRLETWRAFAVEGAHVHAAAPGAACLSEALDRTSTSLPERFPAGLGKGLCESMQGKAHGGPGRLVLLLLPPGDDPAEALAVDVPRLAPEETERTFTDARVELERPAGKPGASIDRGRVTVRRLSASRYDVEVFAVLKGGTQVVVRAEAGGTR